MRCLSARFRQEIQVSRARFEQYERIFDSNGTATAWPPVIESSTGFGCRGLNRARRGFTEDGLEHSKAMERRHSLRQDRQRLDCPMARAGSTLVMGDSRGADRSSGVAGMMRHASGRGPVERAVHQAQRLSNHTATRNQYLTYRLRWLAGRQAPFRPQQDSRQSSRPTFTQYVRS